LLLAVATVLAWAATDSVIRAPPVLRLTRSRGRGAGGAPPGAKPPLRRCTPSEAATLAGGALAWTLAAEVTTAYAFVHDGAPPDAFTRTDIAWAQRGDDLREYVPSLPGCSIRAMTPRTMQACLRDVPVLFVGDSVTRYQFLALAQAVDAGLHIVWDPPSEHDDDFGTWANFYAATTERLGGHGTCDCYRPPNDAPQEVEGPGGLRAYAVLGSRYYRNAARGLELTFLEAFGGAPPTCVWHEPRSFGVDCAKSTQGVEAAGGVCASEPLCKPGF
jgi:hypothetical protein